MKPNSKILFGFFKPAFRHIILLISILHLQGFDAYTQDDKKFTVCQSCEKEKKEVERLEQRKSEQVQKLKAAQNDSSKQEARIAELRILLSSYYRLKSKFCDTREDYDEDSCRKYTILIPRTRGEIDGVKQVIYSIESKIFWIKKELKEVINSLNIARWELRLCLKRTDPGPCQKCVEGKPVPDGSNKRGLKPGEKMCRRSD